MAKTFRTYLSEQDLLLPASLPEWLPDDHLAYFVSDVVDQLDHSAIECLYEGEERGQPPYHPRMMTKILVYGYCVGVFSLQQGELPDLTFRNQVFVEGFPVFIASFAGVIVGCGSMHLKFNT